MSDARKVLRQRPVRLYLASTVLAAVGHNLLVTVLFKQVYDLTGDELNIGFVGLAQFMPAVLLVLVAGWVADSFDRRPVSGVFLAGRGVCSVGLVAYTQIDPGSMWPVFVLAFVLGASDAMLSPARRAIMPLVASADDFPHVVAMWTAAYTGSAIIGPILGGFLYSLGATHAYVLAAVLEFAAIVPIVSLRYVRPQGQVTERPTLSAALDGLRFVRRTPIVLAVISLDLFAVLFGGAVALIPAIASERLGVGDIAYGWLRAAPGIGAAAMAIVLSIRPVRRRVGPMLLFVVGVFGAGTIVLGITRSYTMAFLALVVVSAADMVSMFIRSAIVPLITPDEQLGRVSAVEGVFIGASNELGAFESGVTARAFGLPWSIAGGGVITVMIALGCAWMVPALRRIDTFEELDPSADTRV